ncbi:MAG: Crp/Fnr family transcriptional regulator [Gammaproteobacteria bacterium]|nr:MAG: Crp/Fnr family transcriptional regulator [Gammaproteobacteria bacterium]
MPDCSELKNNHLLAKLRANTIERLRPDFQHIDWAIGEVVYGPDAKENHVYFPADSIVSLLFITEVDENTEVALVGNEGMVGLEAFLGGVSSPSLAVVQSAGCAYRLPATRLHEELESNEQLLALTLRYVQALMTQMAQTVACNRHHSIDQQLCRWLLLSIDRLPRDQLRMTQELIAKMLGVRRESVTEAAGKLQKMRAIAYRRGRITVLDRTMLESLSCECYAVVRAETDRLLPR